MLGIDSRAARSTWTAALVVLALWLVYLVRSTLLIFILAVLFAYLLAPLVNLLDRLLPTSPTRTPALLLAYVLWRAERLAEIRRPSTMFELRLPKFGDGRDDLSGHPQAPDTLVPGRLVGYQPEERCQRHGPPTGAGAEEL